MQTAAERAKQVADCLGVAADDMETRDYLRVMFLEHARDQRHICAEEVLKLDDEKAADAAHALVMNARAPGE